MIDASFVFSQLCLGPGSSECPKDICETPLFSTAELVTIYTWLSLSLHIYFSSSATLSTNSTVLLVLGNNRMSELLTRIHQFAVRTLSQDIGASVPLIF
jgi:hypothetical protein